MRVKDAGLLTANVENKHCITVQFLGIPHPPTPPAFLSSSGFHAQTLERLVMSLFAQQFTPIPHFMQSLQGDKCLRVSRGGQAEVQAMGDGGMSQQCTQPGDNAETNTIWKTESVIVLFLHQKSTTHHCNQHNETGNGRPTERGNYSDTIAFSPQNAATAKAIRTQHLIMASCYI